MTATASSSPPRPTPRPGRARDTRDRALTAARDLILEVGATRTTMVEVARRSGVGRTTLYRHWPDINALLVDLLTRELTGVVARVDPGLPGTAPLDADGLAQLLCTLADEVRTDPLLHALRRHESHLLTEYLLHRLGTSQRRLIDALHSLLAHAIAADPRLAGRDVDATASMLYIAVQGAVLSAPLAEPPLDPDTWRAELHRLIRGYLLP